MLSLGIAEWGWCPESLTQSLWVYTLLGLLFSSGCIHYKLWWQKGVLKALWPEESLPAWGQNWKWLPHLHSILAFPIQQSVTFCPISPSTWSQPSCTLSCIRKAEELVSSLSSSAAICKGCSEVLSVVVLWGKSRKVWWREMPPTSTHPWSRQTLVTTLLTPYLGLKRLSKIPSSSLEPSLTDTSWKKENKNKVCYVYIFRINS